LKSRFTSWGKVADKLQKPRPESLRGRKVGKTKVREGREFFSYLVYYLYRNGLGEKGGGGGNSTQNARLLLMKQGAGGGGGGEKKEM